MIDPKFYLSNLTQSGVEFFSGVPDSLLKDFCACITDTCEGDSHIIAANEGGAIGLAIGHYLACGTVPMVYLQNSGLGNIINPLLSLASKEVYGIPMLIMIGWRGEPEVKDEPQHIHQGRVMEQSLTAIDTPYIILSENESEAVSQTQDALALAKRDCTPVVVLVKKGTFTKFTSPKHFSDQPLCREEAITEIADLMPSDAVSVCTTGMPSRELFEYREKSNGGHYRDFLTVGGMGHASQISLGLALGQSKRKVFCFDGDGAALMHMGSMAIIGQSSANNIIHIILNNGVHDSVGGQPTVGFGIDFCGIASACGYESVYQVDDSDGISNAIEQALISDGPHFIEVLIRPGNRPDLGRPTRSPERNKTDFMSFLKS